MIEITADLVRKLRERTDAGIMDCKKALIEENGNIELAIENMRKSGIVKAVNKGGNKTEAGVILISKVENYGVILEINCQTDFTVKSVIFREFSNKILKTAVLNKINEISELKKKFEEERISLVSRVGENININRVAVLESSGILGAYRHGEHIGVLVSVKNASEDLAKKIAMHIAACRPQFINSKDIPNEILRKEYQIQSDILIKSDKSKEVLKKIVEGRMNKFVKEISLTDQHFVMDESKTVSQVLEEHHAEVDGFIRFEIGESL